ncbi:MAG: HlyD family efflux transporter periplasmic adaptor subunit [Turneriella sp.]|nr:HlyD family efflux transporter periplasmic adaptor subunit [Turneriella sp.]
MVFDAQNLIQELKNLYQRERTEFFRIIGFGVVQGILSLIVPIAVGNLINAVSFGGLLQPVVILTVLVLAFLIVSTGARLLQVWFIEALQRRLFLRVTNEAFESVYRGDSEKMNYFVEVFNLQKNLVALLTDGSTAILAIAIGMLVVSLYHPYFILVNLIILVAAGFIGAYYFTRKGLPASYAESNSKYNLLRWLQNTKHNPRKSPPASEIEALSDDYMVQRAGIFSVIFKQHFTMAILHIAGNGMVLLLGGYLVLKKEMSLGQLVAAEIIVSKMLDAISKFGKYFQNFYDTSDALLKLRKIGAVRQPQYISEEVLFQRYDRYLNPGWRDISWKKYFLGFVLFATFILILPWQQTSYGEGRVVAFSPTERQQTIEAPVSGRIGHWHVHEGSLVRKGDKLVTISDLDPQIGDRLEQERAALTDRVRATQGRVDSIESRITALQLSRSESVGAAENRAAMAGERVRQAQQAVAAAEAALDTAKANFERQKSMVEQGLASQRNLELAELDFKRARTEEQRAIAGLKAAEQEKTALKREARRIAKDADALIGDARASMQGARSELARANEDLPRIELRLSRQKTQEVIAPKDGIITRLLVAQEAEFVREGKGLCVLIPQTGKRAVEIWVDGNDIPLIRDGRSARIMFQGWPALQISGWPQGGFGTFPARVKFVDNADDGHGKFRAVLVPEESADEPWPEATLLKQGVRARGWIFLNRVTVGYELWRKFNDFPPAIPEEYDSPGGKK